MNIPDELIEQIREESKSPALPKAACRRIADAVIASIAEQASTSTSYRVPGLGTFRLRQLAARTVRSPLVPDGLLNVPAKWTLKFRCDTSLQARLNGEEAGSDA